MDLRHAGRRRRGEGRRRYSSVFVSGEIKNISIESSLRIQIRLTNNITSDVDPDPVGSHSFGSVESDPEV